MNMPIAMTGSQDSGARACNSQRPRPRQQTRPRSAGRTPPKRGPHGQGRSPEQASAAAGDVVPAHLPRPGRPGRPGPPRDRGAPARLPRRRRRRPDRQRASRQRRHPLRQRGRVLHRPLPGLPGLRISYLESCCYAVIRHGSGCHPGAGMLTTAAPSGTQLPSRSVVEGPACCARTRSVRVPHSRW